MVDYVELGIYNQKSREGTMVNTIGGRIEQVRIMRGLSQEELAKVANVSQQTISYIEQGKRDNPRSLNRIAAALGVPEAFLRYGEADLNTLDATVMDLAFRVARMTQEDQSKLEDYIALIEKASLPNNDV